MATDWPAFGAFFVALAAVTGGFARWVISRLDKNRQSWQEFVKAEVDAAKKELTAGQVALSEKVDANTTEIGKQGERIITQGESIARISGMISSQQQSGH